MDSRRQTKSEQVNWLLMASFSCKDHKMLKPFAKYTWEECASRVYVWETLIQMFYLHFFYTWKYWIINANLQLHLQRFYVLRDPEKNKEIVANCWKISPKITFRCSFHCPAPQSDRFYASGLETKAALTHHVVEALWCKLSWHFLYCFFKHCEGLLWMKQIKKREGGGCLH